MSVQPYPACRCGHRYDEHTDPGDPRKVGCWLCLCREWQPADLRDDRIAKTILVGFALILVVALLFGFAHGAHAEQAGPPPPKQYRAPNALTVDLADRMVNHVFWLGTASAADLMSTSAALRWCSTCRESNPAGWDAEARISLKAGMFFAVTAVCWKLEKDGHPRGAAILRWVFVGESLAFAASNTAHAIRGH